MTGFWKKTVTISHFASLFTWWCTGPHVLVFLLYSWFHPHSVFGLLSDCVHLLCASSWLVCLCIPCCITVLLQNLIKHFCVGIFHPNLVLVNSLPLSRSPLSATDWGGSRLLRASFESTASFSTAVSQGSVTPLEESSIQPLRHAWAHRRLQWLVSLWLTGERLGHTSHPKTRPNFAMLESLVCGAYHAWSLLLRPRLVFHTSFCILPLSLVPVLHFWLQTTMISFCLPVF